MLSKYLNKLTVTIRNKGALRDTLLLLILLATSVTTVQARQRDTLGTGQRTHFVANQGQWDDPSLFQAQLHNAAIFAETSCLTIALRENAQHSEAGHFHPAMSQHMHAYKVHFVKARPDVAISGQDPDPDGGYDNYFFGHDPSRWVSRLNHYRTLYYSGLYDGIDMDIQVAQHAIKTNFYLSPGAKPDSIVLLYEGVEKLYLSNGNLIIRTSVGEIVEISPYAYQETDTGRCEITARYRINNNEVRFVLGDYNPALPLVIDPVLHFSTYTGSTADNWGTTATYDAHKNTYTAGLVFGIGYPVSVGAYDNTANGNADIGIFKFDTSGTQRIYATYLGGTYADMPHSIYVNAFDELVMFGTTGSSDFPVTPNAYDTSFNGGTSLAFEGTTEINFPNGSDIFVSRFSSDGTQLQASTYVGGSNNDGLNYHSHFNNSSRVIMLGNDSLYFNYGDGARGELITDDLNNIYIGSTTLSYDFPTTQGSFSPNALTNQNGIVFKIDYNLRNMIWSTYLGGNFDDAVYSIDVDSSYNLLVCGGTNSPNFPTTAGCFQPAYGGGSADGFITKISYDGDRIMYSTFYGSPNYDQIYFVRSGTHNEVFVFGQTKATGSTMIYNAAYNVPGSGMLLAKFHPNLDSLEWSTVFGTPLGRPNLSPTAFAADICNRVYAAGWGRDFVGVGSVSWNQAGTYDMETTSDAIQSSTDGQDFYIMSMSADASTLEYATFFGELHGSSSNGGYDHVDGGTSRFDKMATLYQSVCASCYGNDEFPTTPGAWSTHNNSNNCNNALFRINIHNDFAVADFLPPPAGCQPYTVDFVNTGRATSFTWDFGDGTTSTARNPSHTFTQPGNYRVQLIAHMDNGCVSNDTAEYIVHVLTDHGHNTISQMPCNGTAVQIGFRPNLGCTYRWLQGNVSDSSIANPYVTETGLYILEITSLDGCSEIDSFNVEFLDLLDTLLITPPTCPGGSDGRAIARTLPDTSTRIYWDGVLGDTLLTGLSASNQPHSLLIENHDCHIEYTFYINDPPIMKIEKQANTLLCTDLCDGSIHLRYSISGQPVGDTLIDSLCAGTYITLLNDPAGCPYYDTTVIVRDTSLNSLRVWADKDILFLSESTQLHVTPVPGARYNWIPSNTLDRPTSPNPVATPTDTLTIYSVTVTDSLGCTWTGQIPIHCTEVICGEPNVFIPNTFSPNGDGINDRLCFSGKFITGFYIAIYTRWGEKVYETHDINDCWDGRYNDNWCMPGVYTYTCRIQCEAGLENLLKGDITLIR